MPVGARGQRSTLSHPGGAKGAQKADRVGVVAKAKGSIIVADHKTGPQPKDLACRSLGFVQTPCLDAGDDKGTVTGAIIGAPRHTAAQFHKRLLRLSREKQ